MVDEGLKRAAEGAGVLYVYRQAARPAGVGMMIGPMIIAAVAIGFLWFFFWPHEKIWGWGEMFAAVMVWVGSVGFALLACFFFIVGLRRVIYGGAWGCVIDREFLTWSYPKRMSFQGQSVALRDIRSMRIVAPAYGDGDFKEFIVTDTEKLPIDANCYRRLVPFLRVLLRANPAIDVEIIAPGRTRLWPLMRRQIEALCAEARVRRGAANQPGS